MTPPKLSEILKIVNEPGMTWKVRRALLRAKGLSDADIEALVPAPPKDMPWHPGDY